MGVGTRKTGALAVFAVIFLSVAPLAHSSACDRDDRSVFVPLGPSMNDSVTSFYVALPIPNATIIEAELLARATPGSATYGAWLAPTEVLALVEPGAAARAAARAALAGMTCIDTPAGLHCVARVSVINSAFGTTLHTFGWHGESIHRVPPNSSFSLPAAILFVTQLFDFPIRRYRPTLRDMNVSGRRLQASPLVVTPGKTWQGALRESTASHDLRVSRIAPHRVAVEHLQVQQSAGRRAFVNCGR